MAEFLLEIFSEEIPARMQKRAAEDLLSLVSDALAKNGIGAYKVEHWSAPRRIGLCFDELPTETTEVREEIKGPKVGSPQQAIEGFLRKTGLNSIDEARIETDPKKGDFYVVDIVKPGSKTTDILANALPQIIQSFPWPKSMRWGTGNLRWVRPIHSIIALFDGAIVDFEIEGIKSGNKTEGHRFHGNGVFEVSNFADYQTKVSNANVIIDRDVRKAEIMRQIGDICAANNLELIDDIGLLEEVCGLVDKPVVILGQMDESFLDLPPEVIRLTLRINQKYFVLNSKATGKLAPNFIVVSNVAATDGGKAIAHGNARVLAARLNDARYFWDLDRKTSLLSRRPKLETLVFHEKFGKISDKVDRIEDFCKFALTHQSFSKLDRLQVSQAAKICKSDLVTEMVGEFPELQGVMGRYYALNEHKYSVEIADAIRDHYKPVGPSDNVPSSDIACAIAIADKLDTLVGFFSIGERPTGSGDPYALRRAALGVIRILISNSIRMPLISAITYAFFEFIDDKVEEEGKNVFKELGKYIDENGNISNLHSVAEIAKNKELATYARFTENFEDVVYSLIRFFLDRLKVYLRDEGYAHDVIDAVFANQDDDLVRIVNRVKALSDFLKTSDGENLLAGFKRATNILKAEEKKADLGQNLVVNPQHLKENAEKALFSALQQNEAILTEKLQKEDFAGAMKTLAQCRAPIYDFLDNVLVNDNDQNIRLNRLALLQNLRQQMRQVADFEQIRG